MRNLIVTAIAAALLATAGTGIARASAFDYFAGSWECRSDAGSKTFMVYHRVLNGEWLVLQNTFVNSPSGVTGEFIEYYRYDVPDNTWWVSSMGSNGSLEVAMSPDWTDNRLVFEGSTNVPGGSFKYREIYTRWKDGTLERGHYQLTSTGWALFSHSLCHRAA
jgi:hypothetical protein